MFPLHVLREETPFQTGAFGEIFKATLFEPTKKTVTPCVLKVINREAARKIDKTLDLNLEIHINQYLLYGQHPNIVKLLGVFQDIENVQLAFEYATEGDLFGHIDREGRSLPFVLTHGYSLACGLAYLHSCGIVHRDIKPENLLLFNAGPNRPPQLKICDFGLATNAALTGGLCRGACGTVDFMAPEVLLYESTRNPYTAAVDMWSFAVVMFHMATASLPFGNLEGSPEMQKRTIARRLRDPTFHYDLSCIHNPHLQDLLAQLFVFDSMKRLTCFQALLHPVFGIPFVYNPIDFERPSFL